AELASAVMGIQASKGVAIGDGFEQARRRGSEAHDELVREYREISRRRNRAGGNEGGMPNLDAVIVAAAMQRLSPVPRALRTVDMATGEAATGIHQRSDVVAVPAAGVVAEAMVALVLARATVEKFGGGSLAEMKRNLAAYQQQVAERLDF